MIAEVRLLEAYATAQPRDMARQLETQTDADATGVLLSLRPELAAAILQHLTPYRGARYLAAVSPQAACSWLSHLPLGSGAGFLRAMPTPSSAPVLEQAEEGQRKALQELLAYQEGTAGALMDPLALMVRHDYTRAAALEAVRAAPERVAHYVYIIGDDQALVGVLGLRALLAGDPDEPVGSFMTQQPIALAARSSRATVISYPAWRWLRALPVVDRGRLAGVIRYELVQELEQGRSHVGRRGAAVPTLQALTGLGLVCATTMGSVASELFRVDTRRR